MRKVMCVNYKSSERENGKELLKRHKAGRNGKWLLKRKPSANVFKIILKTSQNPITVPNKVSHWI